MIFFHNKEFPMSLFDNFQKAQMSHCDERGSDLPSRTNLRNQSNRRHPALAAAFAAVIAFGVSGLSGCGTTPPPEPEGERVPVNFPDMTVKHDENIPITQPNSVQNRVTVEGPRVESSYDVMMKVSDDAAKAPPEGEKEGVKVLSIDTGAEPASLSNNVSDGNDAETDRNFRFESDAEAVEADESNK